MNNRKENSTINMKSNQSQKIYILFIINLGDNHYNIYKKLYFFIN